MDYEEIARRVEGRTLRDRSGRYAGLVKSVTIEPDGSFSARIEGERLHTVITFPTGKYQHIAAGEDPVKDLTDLLSASVTRHDDTEAAGSGLDTPPGKGTGEIVNPSVRPKLPEYRRE